MPAGITRAQILTGSGALKESEGQEFMRLVLFDPQGEPFNLVGGQTGPQGLPGLQGANGPQGVKGDKGDKGDRGDVGPSGLKGDRGDVGPQGLKGDRGDTGLTGDVGPEGPQGAQGIKGDTGGTGGLGLTGPKGDTGAVGPQGPKGDTGLPGTAKKSFVYNRASLYAVGGALATFDTIVWTWDCLGVPIRFHFDGTMRNATGTLTTTFRMYMDNAPIAYPRAIASPLNTDVPISGDWTFTPPAGSHQFALKAQNNANFGQNCTHFGFYAEECS